MKKTYIAPSVQTVDLNLEGMVAMSIAINNNNDKQIDAADSYTQKGGWDSSNWE